MEGTNLSSVDMAGQYSNPGTLDSETGVFPTAPLRFKPQYWHEQNHPTCLNESTIDCVSCALMALGFIPDVH